MWERKPDGVAIKTNLTGLSRGIRVVPGMHIYIGRVTYIDYERPENDRFGYITDIVGVQGACRSSAGKLRPRDGH